MSNGKLDGYDSLQSFLTEGQAGYDSTPNHSGPTAHPAFHDAEVAKAAFKYSQEQNAYALAEQSNRGTNRPSNPSQGYSQNPSGHYGGSQQYQPSSVRRQQQQQQSSANSPLGSFQHQSDISHNVNRQPSQSASSQRSPTSQLQRLHPSSTAAVEAYRELMQNSVYRGPTGQPQSHSPSMPSSSEAGQNSSMAHETTRPSRSSPPTRPSNPIGARSQSTSQPPHQNYTAIPGHHVGPRIPQRARDQYAEIRSQHMEMAQNPYVVYQTPPFQPVDYREAPQTASVQENRPAPSVQSPHTQAARPQSTSQSPYQGQSAIPEQTAQRSSQSATGQASRPTPPAQRPYTAARTPPKSQSPYQNHSAIPAQAVQKASQPATVQESRPTQPGQRTHTPVGRAQSTSQSPYQRQSQSQAPPSSRSSMDTDTEAYTPLASPKGYRTSADRTTLDPRNLTIDSTKGHETQPAPQAGWKPAPTRPQSQNQAHVRPSRPAVPQRNNSPATFQPTPIRSPSVSSVPPSLASPPQTKTELNAPGISRQDSARSPPVPVAPAAAPAQAVPPTQTANVQQQSDKTWNRNGGNNHGKVAPPVPSWQTVNQTNRQAQASQPNEHVAEGVPTSTPHDAPAQDSFLIPNPPAAVSQKPSYPPADTSTPSSSISTSTPAMAQQSNGSNPTAGNKHSRLFPPPGDQNPGRVTEETDSHLPPAKARRLDNGQRQPVAPQVPKLSQPWTNAPSPGHQSVEPDRHWRQSKILKNRDDLVQRIEPSSALVKVSYDPATIARDVLITAGKHPIEKMLNHHLEALRLNFTRIDYNVDLGTFRWDVADPRRPGDSQAPVAPRAAPQAVTKLASRPVPQSDPQPAPQPAPRPIPQYAPQPAPLPQYTAPARPFNPPYASPYSQAQYILTRDTSRDTPLSNPPPSNRIDTRTPPNGFSSWGTLPFKPPTYYSPQRASSSTILSGLPNLDPTPPPEPSPPKISPLVFVPLPPSQNKQATPARPAPPPTVKQKTPQSTSKTGPKGQTAKPPPAKTPTSKSPNIRRLPQPQVVIPASADKMPQKRKPGRPAKNEAKGIEVAIPPREEPVNYQVFPCKWEGCVAELHNLDAVRAHLVKVHVPHHLLCKWRGCGNTMHMAAADMFSHVANEHISKMAWELGDGPAVPETAETAPTQPSFGRSARRGTMVLPVDEHQLKAFCKAHGITTETAKAEALLEAGRHWKQQIGPELDSSDRRLSTPARQINLNCAEMAFISPD